MAWIDRRLVAVVALIATPLAAGCSGDGLVTSTSYANSVAVHTKSGWLSLSVSMKSTPGQAVKRSALVELSARDSSALAGARWGSARSSARSRP